MSKVTVGVGVVNVDAGVAAKWVSRGIAAVAILLVAVLLLAVLAFHRGHEVEVACGPTVSTPLGDKGLDVSGKLGDLMASPDFSSPWQIVKTVFGVIEMLKLWFDNLTSHAQKLPEGSAATGWRRETERQRAAALASCCPATTPPPDSPDTAPVPPFDPKTLSFQSTEFTPGQLGIARTIVSVAKAKDVPQRGWIVAFATAFQESGMRNLDYGDRDSLGVFQQRPSQGWGSAAQVQDPKYAAAVFYDHLLKVPGWQTLSVTQAAQAVQRSGFPDAYAKWEDDANRILAAIGDVAPAPPTTPNLSCPALAGGSGQLDAKVATWNVRKDNSVSHIEQGVAALSSAADVIGLQELGDEGRRAVAAHAAQGMAMTTAPVAVPILYSTSKYTAEAQGAELAFPETQAELSHGDRKAGPKWVSWVQLQDTVTGRRFTVVNTHMLVGWQGNPERTRLYARQLARTLAVVDRSQASGDPVLVTGDFNASNVPAMASHGLTSSLTTATHGKRTIDRVYSSGATPTRHDVLPDYGSDHNAVVATFVAAGSPAGGGPVPASFKGNPRTVAQAMAWLQARVDNRTPIEPNNCSHYVANAYGWPESGSPTALTLWSSIPGSRKNPGKSSPPRGALVFWHTSQPEGHIAISAGGGMIYSTDVPTGRWGLVPIARIDAWGPRVGWSSPYWPAHRGDQA